MVPPGYLSGGFMSLDDEQLRQLAALEEDLARRDPGMIRRFARLGKTSFRTVGAGENPTWGAVTASLLLLLANSELFLVALAHDAWWLVAVSVCLFPLVLSPAVRSMRRGSD
jgi:hypothetical protein